MSLILDALKRAERERKLEKAPDLSAIYQEGGPSRRKTHPWFWAGGAFLITFVAVTIIFWPKAPPEINPKDKAPKLALADSAKVADVTTAGTAPTRAKRSLPKNPSKPLSVAGKSVKHTPPPVKPLPVSQERVEQTLASVNVIREKAPELPDAPPPKKDVAPPPPVPEPIEKPVALKRTEKRPTAAVKVAPEAQPKVVLPLFDDLPEEIQSVLGPLEINVHMYSPNPPERRVFINMQGYREGDTIGESGFRLVEITSYGVVIDYGKG
ncbi:MAG: general secretion pathway protein GspB, partial [Deltaproteobacteria bacterium]|nr:general secretion pathway protein GspB [Deltaproteobacteria bacterium]